MCPASSSSKASLVRSLMQYCRTRSIPHALSDTGDSLSPVLRAPLVLHPDPQLVHLCEVDQQELDGVIDVSPIALVL